MFQRINSSQSEDPSRLPMGEMRRSSRVRRAVQLLWCTLLLAPSLVPSRVQAQEYRTVSGRVFLNGVTACEAQTTHTFERQCSGQGTFGEIRASVGADGLLHAEARVTDQRYAAQDEVQAWAQAFLFDQLTFEGAVMPSSVRVSLFLHGGVTGSNSSFGSLSLYHGGTEPVHSISIDGAIPTGGIGWGIPSAPSLRVERTSYTMDVVNGRVDFALALMARAHLPTPSYDEDETHCGIGDCVGRGARADFLNTAGIELLEALDADGNVIGDGLVLRSAANVQYAGIGTTSVPVPEPGKGALLLIGASALFLHRRSRGVARW